MARPDYWPPKYQGQFSHLNDEQLEEGIRVTTKVFIENLHKGLSDEEMEEILYKAGLDYLATLERKHDEKPETTPTKAA